MARILLIEDEKNIARAVRDKLTHQGFTVQVFQSGPEALQWLVTEAPDVILLDLLLPEMDGFEILGRIRAEARTKDIPVIILSVLAEEERVKKLPIQGFLHKPYKNSELLAIVQDTLARYGGN
jgi:DNA-binding response OmpR family regulator